MEELRQLIGEGIQSGPAVDRPAAMNRFMARYEEYQDSVNKYREINVDIKCVIPVKSGTHPSASTVGTVVPRLRCDDEYLINNITRAFS
jgi:hypothetical protein